MVPNMVPDMIQYFTSNMVTHLIPDLELIGYRVGTIFKTDQIFSEASRPVYWGVWRTRAPEEISYESQFAKAGTVLSTCTEAEVLWNTAPLRWLKVVAAHSGSTASMGSAHTRARGH